MNQELKVKIEELSHSNNNFQNLLNSTDIATIFLDRGLRVNLFSPSARSIFNLLPSDVGRPLSDIYEQTRIFGRLTKIGKRAGKTGRTSNVNLKPRTATRS